MIELRIRMLDHNSIEVACPIDDKRLCYALLEMARDAVKDHTDKLIREQQHGTNGIVPVRALDMRILDAAKKS